MTTLRIFISSPSDVFAERERADRVVQRVAGELAGAVTLEALRWERSFYTAAQTFQDQIARPSECDLVICILWKRLGAELPPAYRRPDGSIPTGTEYEFEDAIEAGRRVGKPDVLVYRKTAPVLLDAENVEHERDQFDRLKLFWQRWFRSEQGHFTAAYHTFETTDGFAAELESHLRQWLQRRQALDAAAVPWPIALKGSPFRGLQAFGAAHAAVFFGRRRATERLRERLTQAAAAGGVPFLVILGQSGAGKSSIARAGLLPRLTQPGAVPGVEVWRHAVLRPSEAGDDPVAALCAALYRPEVLPELADGDSTGPADLATLLSASAPAAARAVRRALDRVAAAAARSAGFDRPLTARLLLVIDQLEEALARPAAARDGFAGALRALAEQTGGAVWIIATLRSDFYAAFQAVPDLVALKEAGAQADLLAPTPAEIAEIITGPAQAAGLRFDQRDGLGLDEALLQDAAAPGSLPLLQLALDALFEAREPATGTLTWAAYDGVGRLQGVVERRAEATLSGLDAAAQATLPRVLTALVAVGEDGLAASRAAPLAQAAPDAAAGRLVDAFITARLMVSDAGAQAAALIRVAHEALIAAWPRARVAIAADQALLAARFRVEAAERAWTANGRHPDDLLPPGRKLAEAVELAEARPDLLSPATAAFIAAGRDADAARQEAERARAEHALRLQTEAAQARADAATRVVRRTRAAVAVVSVLLVAAVAAAGYAALQRRTAQARTAEAERNFGLALDAGNTVVSAVFDHMRTGGLKLAAARDLLDRAAGTFGSLAAVADTPELATRQAKLDGTLSDARALLGDPAGALAAARQGTALARRMLAQQPDSPAWLRSLAVGRSKEGSALVRLDRLDDALAAYREAEATLTRLLARAPDFPLWLRDLGIARDGEAGVLRARRDLAGALAAYQQTLTASEALAAAAPNDAIRQRDLSVALENVADVLAQLGRRAEAHKLYERDLAIALRLQGSDPGNTDWQLSAAISRERMGDSLLAQGDAAAAAEQYRAAVATSDALAARDRENAEWQADDAIAHAHLSAADAALGHPVDALADTRVAEAVYRRLVDRDPGNLEWQERLAAAQVDAARFQQIAGDLPGALATLRGAVAARESFATADPANLRRRHDLQLAHEMLTSLLVLSGKPDEAVVPARAALAAAQRSAEAMPRDTQAQLELAIDHARLGDVLSMSHDIPAATAAYQAGDTVIESLAQAHSDDPAIRRQLALARRNLGVAAINAGHPDAALTHLQAALPLFQAAAAAAPANAAAQTDLASTHEDLAWAMVPLHRRDDAEAELQAAQRVLDGAMARTPGNAALARQRELVGKLLASLPPPAARPSTPPQPE